MVKVAIWGESNLSDCISSFIYKIYNKVARAYGAEELLITAVLAKGNANNNLPYISIEEYIDLYKAGMIHALIIPINHFYLQTSILTDLIIKQVSLDDVYILKRLDCFEYKDDMAILDAMMPYLQAKYLPYLEYHVADKCNLNCIACEHYSGLVKQECFPDLARFTTEFHRLKELVDDIGTIRILGGEPLLNPELSEYVKLTRRLYPYSNIRIVTNGLLIRNMSDELIEAIKENDVRIHVSNYPLMIDQMPDIRHFLKEKGIQHAITYVNTKFQKKQTLIKERDRKFFYKCFQARCNNLYQGKMAPCFLPFMTRYYNEHFGTSLPEGGAISIMDDKLTSEELLMGLLKPIERCEYCTEPVEVEWDYIRDPDDLSNWLVEYPKAKVSSNSLVSIYLHCRDNEIYLEKCLLSVINQTHEHFELYVYCGDAPAKVKELIERYASADSRIIPVYKSVNEEQTFIDFIRESGKGQYFAAINSNSWWDVHYLETLVGYADRYKLDMAIGGTSFYNAATGRLDILRKTEADIMFNTREREVYFSVFRAFLDKIGAGIIRFDTLKNANLDIYFEKRNEASAEEEFMLACFEKSQRVAVISKELLICRQ